MKDLNKMFEMLYVDADKIALQKIRYEKAIQKFEELYGKKEYEIYSTPGRSEIAGNHTDHQKGKVLAASIDLDVIAIVAKNNDNKIRVVSDGYVINDVNTNDYTIYDEEVGKSEALIRGMCKGFVDAGYDVGGFDAYMTSNVLSGSGLSSSAAFEVMIGTILSYMYNQNEVSAVRIAQIAQFSENVYFQKPCGLMDQMACSVGGFVYIDFYDDKNPIVEKLEFDFTLKHHKLCIVDTKGSHADLTDEYGAIPYEMKEVAKFLGKEYLSYVDEKAFYANLKELRNVVSDRAILRAMHLFNENKRVIKQRENLKNNDFDAFLNLIKESGFSSFMYLQNVSTRAKQEQELAIGLGLCSEILQDEGAYRVHGGGFAGTIQAFVPEKKLNEFIEKMETVYGKGSCYVLNVRPVGGIKVL